MKTIQERRLEFITTELQPYIDNPSLRAINSKGLCVYLDKTTGNKCLVGKQIPKEKYKEEFEDESLYGSDKVWESLPEEIKELGREFLSELQHLHDSSKFWSPEFNKEGKTYLEETIKEYCSI